MMLLTGISASSESVHHSVSAKQPHRLIYFSRRHVKRITNCGSVTFQFWIGCVQSSALLQYTGAWLGQAPVRCPGGESPHHRANHRTPHLRCRRPADRTQTPRPAHHLRLRRPGHGGRLCDRHAVQP